MTKLETLQAVLEERAHSNSPGHLIFYPLGNNCSPMQITYAGLYEQARRISRIVQHLEQFEVGHPILLHFEDHWDMILWFWSVLLAGGLPVPSSPFSNVDHERHQHIQGLSNLLESPICFTRYKNLALFGDSRDLYLYPIEILLEGEKEQSHAQDTRINGHLSDPNNGNDSQARGVQSGYCASDDAPKCHNMNGTDGRALSMLVLTSGSTGNAKAVSITHAQVLAAVSGKAAVRKLPQDRPFLNWIGLDHVAALVEIHLQALWLGVDQVHVNAADVVTSPDIFLDLLSRHRVSRTFAPNFFLTKLVSTVNPHPKIPAWDFSSLGCITSGGEPNDIKTCLAASDLFSRYGAPRNVVVTGFGMTETCAGAVFNTECPEYDLSRGYTNASLGRCINGMEMRVTTPGGDVAAPDEPGDLEVRGPVVFTGYYRDDFSTSQAFTHDHWFRTGDRGAIDSSGCLNLVGRTKDVININGVKFVAADVQTALEDVLGNRVERLVAFPSTNSHTEQVTVSYVPKLFPMRDEDMVEVARLATQTCLIRTATRPVVFALREESIPLLPMSTLGKISRLKMARLFEDGTFTTDLELSENAMLRASKAAGQVCKSRLTPTSDTEARLLEDIAETMGLNPQDLGIHPEMSLFDIGFTSMHVLKLKYHIEKRLGINISVFNVMNNPTIQALAAHLDTRLQNFEADSNQDVPDDSYDPVVVFRAGGSKKPLWLIHPGVGEVLVFVGLAQCLAADDRPVYALRAAGFEPNHQRFESIKQAVDVYTGAVRRCQPRGPYALAGYSFGTMLAFEVAKRLEADGDKVGFLGSFNLPPHIKQRIRTLNWNSCLLHLSHFLGLVTEEVSDNLEVNSAFSTMSRAEAIRWVLEIAHKQRWNELNLEIGTLARWVDVAFGLQRMASDYDPSGQVSSVDVFHCVPLKAVAKSREVWLREFLSHWADFVREPPRFHAVQGEHYTMIGAEHVASFAQSLMEALKAKGL